MPEASSAAEAELMKPMPADEAAGRAVAAAKEKLDAAAAKPNFGDHKPGEAANGQKIEPVLPPGQTGPTTHPTPIIHASSPPPPPDVPPVAASDEEPSEDPLTLLRNLAKQVESIKATTDWMKKRFG